MSQAFGPLLRSWRERKRLSQMTLSLDAEISTKHLSFLENNKTNPSREMVLLLSRALELPLRDRNALLQAAGFAAAYRETDLSSDSMGVIREVLTLILEQALPSGAIVIDGNYDIIMSNEAANRSISAFVSDPAALASMPLNSMRMVFHPELLRPSLTNWEQVATALLERLRSEARVDERVEELLREFLSYPDVSALPRISDGPPLLLIPLNLRSGDRALNLFTTITTLGTPQDITLAELRIETFYPADPRSKAFLRDELERG